MTVEEHQRAIITNLHLINIAVQVDPLREFNMFQGRDSTIKVIQSGMADATVIFVNVNNSTANREFQIRAE